MKIRALLLILVALMFATSVSANPILPDPKNLGLVPGTVYRFAFLTSMGTNALSADISVYDSFVQQAADLAGIGSSLGLTWSAVVSTPTVSAIDHVGLSNDRIFNVAGGLFSLNGTVNLFDGIPDNAQHSALVVDEFGTDSFAGPLVWTGMTILGGSDTFALGSPSGFGAVGLGGSPSIFMLNDDIVVGPQPLTALHPLYALSAPLVAPQVPEPSTVWLAGSGLALVFVIRRRRK